MESKYDRFLRLKNTLRLIQDDQMNIDQLVTKLEAAEIDLTQSLSEQSIVNSKIIELEKKHNMSATEFKSKLIRQKNRIFFEFRSNKNIISKKHPKLKGLTWEEYTKNLAENPTRKWSEEKLFVLAFLLSGLASILEARFDLDSSWSANPFDSLLQFSYISVALASATFLIASIIMFFIPMSEAEIEKFVKKMVEKHKDIETETETAKSKILKLENAKKQIVKQLESIKGVLSVQSKLMKKIEALGEKITDSAEQMIKLQTDVSHNWDSITDLIPSDSTMMFPKQLND